MDHQEAEPIAPITDDDIKTRSQGVTSMLGRAVKRTEFVLDHHVPWRAESEAEILRNGRMAQDEMIEQGREELRERSLIGDFLDCDDIRIETRRLRGEGGPVPA